MMHYWALDMCGYVGHRLPNKLYHCGGKPKDSDSPQAQFVGQVLSQHVDSHHVANNASTKIAFNNTPKMSFGVAPAAFSGPNGPSQY